MLHEVKRIPLWMKLEPLTKADVPPPMPPAQNLATPKPVYAVAEPERGFDRIDFDSISDAAQAVGVVQGNIGHSLTKGARAAGRLWWYANLPEFGRPTPKTSFSKTKPRRNLPVMVDGVKYKNAASAARHLGMVHWTLCRQIRSGMVFLGKHPVPARYLSY